MTLSSQRAENVEDALFVARVGNVRSVLQILRAIHFRDQAIMYCTKGGLRVTVEDFKCVQATAFIESNVFEEYYINKNVEDDTVQLGVPLAVILECLNIFGTGRPIASSGIVTTLKMSYKGCGFPLEMLLEEDGVITNCMIRTQTADDILDFNYDQSTALNKVIIKSDALKEIMNDLDVTSEVVEILLSPDPPYIRLSTAGDCGESQTDIPKDCHMVESFNCSTVLSFCYKFCHIKPSIKPLALSSKVSIRINDTGLLCFQYMIQIDNSTCFVEYYCTPIVEIDDSMS